MNAFALLFLLFTATISAQVIPTASILPEIPDDAVLAVFDDGAKFTMQQFRALYLVLPPNAQQAALKEREKWIQQYAFFRKLAQIAEREKLDQVSPTKEALEYNRMHLLMQVALNANMNTTIVEGEDIVNAYKADQEKFKQVKLKVIYVAFVSEALAKSGAKGLTEEQARAKAAKLVQQIRSGADFVEMVKAHSDDRDSREKNGDYETMRRTDNIPDAIRSAVFALKTGEITDPVRQSNGFYIFKAEDVSYRPLSDVRDEIYNQLKMKRHQQWIEQTNAATKVQLVNEQFFKPSAPSGAPLRPEKSTDR